MADELGAVLEAPEVDVVPDVAQTDAPVVDDTPKDDAAPVEDIKGDERKIKQHWRELREAKPEMFKEYKSLLFGKEALEQKLSALGDADKVIAWLTEQGGQESIAQTVSDLQGKAQELDEIQQGIATGNPAIIGRMIEASPEGFAKLAPVVAEKWAEADPEGWKQAMSGVFAATIVSNGIPMFLERMGLMLEYGKTEEVAQAITQLKGWANGFQQVAAAAPKPQQNQAQPDKFAEREQAIAAKEQEQFNASVESDLTSWRSTEIGKELASFAERRPKDEDAKQLAIETVQTKVLQRLHGDKDFKDKVNALFAKRDKDGALRLIKSREAKAIAEIAPGVGRSIFGQPAVKEAPKVAPKVETPVRRPAKADPFDSIWGRA